MNPRERFESVEEANLAALGGLQSRIWTALPGILQSFDPIKMTVEIQPAIRANVRLSSGKIQQVQLPLLVDCPVQFPGGGGFLLTFPLQPGDEALIILASRCIDAWWSYGGVQSQADIRMHDLSDGFALPGIRSIPRLPSGPVNTVGVELRNDADTVSVNLTNAEITVTATTRISLNAPLVEINGVNFLTHQHTGVTSGTDNTGPVFP